MTTKIVSRITVYEDGKTVAEAFRHGQRVKENGGKITEWTKSPLDYESVEVVNEKVRAKGIEIKKLNNQITQYKIALEAIKQMSTESIKIID